MNLFEHLFRRRQREPLLILRFAAQGSTPWSIPLLEQQFLNVPAFGNPVSLSKVARYCNGKQVLPRRPVVLTFDIPDPTQLGLIQSALVRSGLPATVFIPASAAAKIDPDTPLLEVGYLATRGEVGTSGKVTERGRELADKRAAMEQRIGAAVNAYAYADKLSDDDPILIAALAGFRVGLTLEAGVNRLGALSPMTFARVSIDPTLSADAFARQLAKIR